MFRSKDSHLNETFYFNFLISIQKFAAKSVTNFVYVNFSFDSVCVAIKKRQKALFASATKIEICHLSTSLFKTHTQYKNFIHRSRSNLTSKVDEITNQKIDV